MVGVTGSIPVGAAILICRNFGSSMEPLARRSSRVYGRRHLPPSEAARSKAEGFLIARRGPQLRLYPTKFVPKKP
jgi:hypothetical protein